MATLTTTKLHVAGRGHVFVGAVDAAPPALESFVFGTEASYGSFTWLGDTSAQNLVSFETEGGGVTYKRTWDRPNVRAIREDESISMTINSVNVGKDTFELAFGGSVYDSATKSTKVGTATTSLEKSVLIVMVDGSDVAGMYLPRVDMKGSFPTFDLEEMTEIPITGAVLGSNKTVLPSGPMAWQWFEPRARTA